MKKKVVLEVDHNQLFDMLHKMKGDTSAIGSRLVETLLSAEVSLSTAIGLGVYGIVLAEVIPIIEHIEVKVAPFDDKWLGDGPTAHVLGSDEGSGP